MDEFNCNIYKNIDEKIDIISNSTDKMKDELKEIREKNRILCNLYESKTYPYKELIKFFLKGNLPYIMKNNIVVTEELKDDINILDNLHDFEKSDRNEICGAILREARDKIYRHIKNENIKNIIKKTRTPNSVIRDINKNDIFNKILNTLSLPYFSNKHSYNEKMYDILKNYSVYFETPGLFEAANCVCPFKKSIDEYKCLKDTKDSRKKYNNIKIISKNPYMNNSTSISTESKTDIDITFNIEDKYLEYYMPFFQEKEKDELNNILLKTETKSEILKLNNSISNIGNIINKYSYYVKKEQHVEKFSRILYSGFHLKYLGDYIQTQIFNSSDINIFQTSDKYCYLNLCLNLNVNKIILQKNLAIFTKFKYEEDEYILYHQPNIVDNHINVINFAKNIIDGILNGMENITNIPKKRKIETHLGKKEGGKDIQIKIKPYVNKDIIKEKQLNDYKVIQNKTLIADEINNDIYNYILDFDKYNYEQHIIIFTKLISSINIRNSLEIVLICIISEKMMEKYKDPAFSKLFDAFSKLFDAFNIILFLHKYPNPSDILYVKKIYNYIKEATNKITEQQNIYVRLIRLLYSKIDDAIFMNKYKYMLYDVAIDFSAYNIFDIEDNIDLDILVESLYSKYKGKQCYEIPVREDSNNTNNFFGKYMKYKYKYFYK